MSLFLPLVKSSPVYDVSFIDGRCNSANLHHATLLAVLTDIAATARETPPLAPRPRIVQLPRTTVEKEWEKS